MSDASEWTLISPLASFRCRFDDIFLLLSHFPIRGGDVGKKIFSGLKWLHVVLLVCLLAFSLTT
jgi:hypothetical protein